MVTTAVPEKSLAASLRLQLPHAWTLSDEQFFEFCQANRDLRFERSADGELLVMTPTGGETGKRNLEILLGLALWSKKDGTGAAFDSSTGFRLPNGSVRSPDASWVSRVRLDTLTTEEKKKFLPLCPDFVVELLSESDETADLQAKLVEYMENGAKLGWLIDPQKRKVYVYQQDHPVKELDAPITLSGSHVLPGFELPLQDVWAPI